ncbi:MAG: UDP-glucose--hexose-1-phosphate uridylyltransferase [Christensenellaceae bacterium]|jgi:UDPglucose--hexose-1-phosphate uridylyltransferase|nr:UDP-glucose--hexose-1-phosphate uridylyltransferase [Christensenellaceae bacterium]
MPRKIFNIADAISTLCDYAMEKLYLSKIDRIYAENQLLALFKQSERSEAHMQELGFQVLLNLMVDYALSKQICTEDETMLFEGKIMGLVTPSPNEVISRFDNIAANEGIEIALQYLNNISSASNYIRMVDIEKNVRWTAEDLRGDLTITINLSKPEKDNKQVLLAKTQPQTNYPKCPLCLENVGFSGDMKRAARQSLRVIPIELAGEDWYFQFSPYVYYEDHCIALSETHRPMSINARTFTRLLDFVDLFPHYFIGSNADLPIVGGSILSHDHFQGGKKVLPMLKARSKKWYSNQFNSDVSVSILDWYNSVILLKGEDRHTLEMLSSTILEAWREYSDPQANIYAKTEKEPHNTVTPIATFNDDSTYSIYLILRNNRTDKEHPHGIFHPTEDMHNIKKEGIGLIEAMGTFILPGRLFYEKQRIINILTGADTLNFKAIHEDLQLTSHLPMIMQLVNDFGTSCSIEKAEEAVVSYINLICKKILDCTAVFKNTSQGECAFERFFQSINYHPINF